MKLGCCVHNFNSWTFEEAVRLTHDLGFRFGNIGLGPLGGIEAVLRDPDAVAARIRDAAQAHGFDFRELMVFAISPVEGASDPLASAAERFDTICRCMASAGLTSILGSLSVPPLEGASESEAKAHRVTSLKRAVRIANEHGLELNIEPGFTGELVKKPETALELLDDVPGLGLSLDFCHFLAAGVPQEDGFRLLPRARQLHIKQAARGYVKSLYHHGEVDYAAIIQELKRIDWQGDMVMECLAFTQDERYDWDTYTEVRADWNNFPAKGRLTHPVFQTIALAYEVERLLVDG